MLLNPIPIKMDPKHFDRTTKKCLGDGLKIQNSCVYKQHFAFSHVDLILGMNMDYSLLKELSSSRALLRQHVDFIFHRNESIGVGIPPYPPFPTTLSPCIINNNLLSHDNIHTSNRATRAHRPNVKSHKNKPHPTMSSPSEKHQ